MRGNFASAKFYNPPPVIFRRILSLGLVVQVFLFLLATPSMCGDPSLINIKELAPNIVVDMRYATENNFTHRTLYPVAECLLCEPAAQRLALVQKSLEKQGLGLKVWDCYRPLSIQKELWALVPDPRYVADPKTGSRHNRGASIDLTLVDKKGKELPMPTEFDEFTERAHRNYMDLPKNALTNRKKLQDAMEAQGFIGIPTEWWHFDDPEWNKFSLRDEPLGSSSLLKDVPASVMTGEPAAAGVRHASQLIVVLSSTWSSTSGRLQRYEKKNQKWEVVGKPWDVSLGIKGMAKGVNSPMEGPDKTEGDLKAPAGIFKVGQAYGYDPKPKNLTWPYQHVDEKWICVDDPQSTSYNRVFASQEGESKDWTSAEKMKRNDHLYQWVINIEYNFADVKAGCGSCIFFHVWRKPLSGTEGCTAMSEENIKELLFWLKPEADPYLVQMPEDVYRVMKEKERFP